MRLGRSDSGFGMPRPPQQQFGTTGRLEGTAQISLRLTTTRARVRVYSEPGTLPAAPQAEDTPLANVVLYLEPITARTGAPSAEAAPSAPAPVAAMRQHGERFVPHVLPVVAGSTVDFPNDDPIYHNVFSLSRARTFDLGRYQQGSSKSIRFTTPGVAQVFCHIHADMSGYIVVVREQFFTVPGAQGRYAIADIPPGDYRLIAWHERIRPLVTPVHIEAGQTTNADLQIPIPDAPGKR